MKLRHVLFAVAGFASAARAADDVWIEGERPTSGNYAKVEEVKFGGWGNRQYLSEGAWLNTMIEGQALGAVPQGGIVMGYDFTVAKAGTYEVWNRIGYEFVRSPFAWRIDAGAWQTVAPQELTTDLMDVDVWCEVAWLKMGAADLPAGRHTLEVKLEVLTAPDKEGKPVPQRILYASDALCLSLAPFRPNGRFKPDETWQDDADRAAAGQVFEVKAGAAPQERVETPLSGAWQIARYDEQEIRDRAGPIAAVPRTEDLFWKAIAVPGDRNAARPEWIFCHRYFYRTRVRVPADLKGRSFYLHFPSVNMIATVFVNGRPCGWTKAPFANWDCDITSAIQCGATNEIWVGIKDTYYGLATDTRREFNVPPGVMDSNQGVSMRLDFPVWNRRANGILESPALVTCGPVYVADAFAMPSVKEHRLALEITLRNPGSAAADVSIGNEVTPLEGGAVEKRFAAARTNVPAGGEAVVRVAEAWANPKLWWPDDPRQYAVATTVSQEGKPIDTRRTKFGFREWTWTDGPAFKLNGVPWHGRADLSQHSSTDPAKAVATWRQHGQTMFRFWATGWAGLDQVGTLDFMDANGMPVRRSGLLDGEMASYGLAETVKGPDGKDRQVIRKDLFDNWRTQLEAQVRGERNHPSLFIWSVENEIVYINSANRGLSRTVEPAVRDVCLDLMKLDPTRPTMVDGGNALFDDSLPVYGCHYPENDDREYPDEAYTLEKSYAEKSRNLWPLGHDKPIFFGETFFARGIKPAGYAQIGGESAFLGRSECTRPIGLLAKMYSEGYRWHGLAAFHFWFGDGDATLHYNAWQPVCVLCRQWNWTFAGGATVPRTLKVLNDTPSGEPIDMAWEFSVGDRLIQSDRQKYRVAPGLAQEAEIALKAPAVKDRAKGQFTMTCSRAGKEVFREVKDLSVIDPDAAAKPNLAASDLLVLDPKGPVKARLTARGIAFTAVARFEDLPESAKVVVVGPDALTSRQATDGKWLMLASAGARILVLDQTEPLHFQAVPADLEVTPYVGRVAFAEDLDHPVFSGLEQSDFFTWSGDHVVYRNAYRKASRGAKSLAQCDDELSCSAIAECQVNEGVMVLCQMVVGSKLAGDPVARRLFDNMLNYVAGYRVVRKATAVVMDENSPAAKLLSGSGLQYDPVADVLAAVSDGRHDIVIADAAATNLKALAGAADKLKAFTDRGGTLMLWGLGPDGLADFDRLVGVPHLLRPFEMEKVMLAAPRDPLTAGLTMRDVVMESGQKIAAQVDDRFAANDVFSGVVDLDDIAPFCQIPGPEYWGNPGEKPGFDHWPRNMVNGFVSADSWKYCFMILLNKKDKAGNPTPEPTRWTMTLPREEEIAEFSIALNVLYHKVTRIDLYFDDDKTPVRLETKTVNERQDFPLDPPRKCKALTIDLADWEKSGSLNVIGLDNLWIRVKRPDDFTQRVRPMLNIGALVRYPMGEVPRPGSRLREEAAAGQAGQGGIVLNQIKVLANEAVPINAQKKQTIVSTILRNLGAVYAGGKTLTAANLTFAPLSLGDQCNQYLTADRGWFDAKHDLGHLPNGENKFAGVPFIIRDFKTSPVPSCVMLAGHGVKGKLPKEVTGLVVGRKANVLFFLHTAKAVNAWRQKPNEAAPVAFKYVVHYADGATAEVPVRCGEGVDDWITTDPHSLKSAGLAWAAAFPGETGGEQAVLFEMPWMNPRPEVPIASIDLAYDGKSGGNYFVPALLAVTAGTEAK